jgi:hypothetical protein
LIIFRLQDNEYKLFLNEELKKKHTVSGMVSMKSYRVNLVIPVFIFYLGSLSADATGVNFDTAWTFSYDGERDSVTGNMAQDIFRGIAVTENGSAYCAGEGNGISQVIKLDSRGKMLFKKMITTNNTIRTYYNAHTLHSICLAKNGDVIVGGERFGSPWILRLDTLGNIKWSTWYYDSLDGVLGSKLLGNGVVNSVCETSWGKIVCAGGDEYPYNGGSGLNNYAFFMEFYSSGKTTLPGEWRNETGYTIGGFSIVEASNEQMLIAGNMTVICLDSSITEKWKSGYSTTLEGVGTVTNKVNRVKRLRDGRMMIAGEAYEGNCWTRFKKLYLDAWWAPINIGGGGRTSWDTAGIQGKDDALYDFIQLKSGNIAFTGVKQTSPDSGIWVFVTDSTGKNLLWEKQYDFPGKDSAGFRFNNMFPYAIAATPDSGFTVVGYKNGAGDNYDAIAMHFVPMPSTRAAETASAKRAATLQYRTVGKSIIFEFSGSAYTTIRIFNAGGMVVASIPHNSRSGGFATWNCSRAARGVYFYQLQGTAKMQAGTFVVR